ncbi:MAG: SusC/RagA family TonB-linked outer membrane protein [Ginsengibacter sp.]
MRKKIPFVTLMLFALFCINSPLNLLAQNIEVSGRVTGSAGQGSLQGVSVNIKGTTVGTATDTEGNYQLTKVPQNAVLEFSIVGFINQEIRVDSRKVINVTLKEGVAQLSEVVIIGYGKQQRAEVTGSIASITAEQLQDIPVSSFENAIQGKVAGVDISMPSGEPGASPQIRVRGTGSVSAGSDPLYVIDGLPISKNARLQSNLGQRTTAFAAPLVNPFSTINPNDIKSIEILKDASSAGIYGSRGSNGVVLITTNKGSKGKTRISLNTYKGVTSVTHKPDMMGAKDLIELTKESRNFNYLQTYDPLNPASKFYNPVYDPNTNAGREKAKDDFVLIPEKYINWDGTDTDWLGLIFSPGSVSSYNLSAGGGKDNFTYYLSGGYYKENGIIKGSDFDRYTLKSSFVNDITRDLQIGFNINLAYTNNNRLPVNAPYTANPPGIVYSAMVNSPVVKPYNEDGTVNQLDGQNHLGGGTTTADNPFAIMEAVKEKANDYRTFGNVYGQYAFLNHFNFKTYLGIDVDNFQQSFYKGNSLLYRGARQGDPYGQASSGQGVNWLWENTLNYNNAIGEHTIDGLVGYTAQKQSDVLKVVVAQKFPDDQITTISGGIVTAGNEVKEQWSLVSALARVNYAFKEKYLLTATIRSDRSSRFGYGNQTGYFPSGSVGWRIKEEPFLDKIDFLNELKIRASYGVTGNFEIPNYGSIALLSARNYVLNNQIVNGVTQSTLGNKNLSWETTRSVNLGLDFAFLHDRIYGAFDYYISHTSNLLLYVTIPSSSGFSNALTNIGKVENKGFEASFTSRNLVGKFKWSTDFNFSSNRNKVLALGDAGDPILSEGGAGLRHITRIGDPIGSYYGYIAEGIYQSQEEILKAPKDMLAPDPAPGDIRFKDVNGDGKITPEDRTILGSYFPDFTFGLNNKFRYKNFDLGIFIQGVQGREILNLTRRQMLSGVANFNSYAILKDRWVSPGNPGNGIFPRADRNTGLHGNNMRESSYQVEDGSYIRLRNVTLGYEFKWEKVSNKIRVYVSGTNLWMATKYIGFNPEVNNQQNSSLTPGEDYGAYPLSKTVMLGLNISF